MQVHWPQSQHRTKTKSFRDTLRDEIQSAKRIDIVSGYVGKSAATNFGHHLIACARRGGRVRILIGMAGTEGLTEATHQAWSSIHEQLQQVNQNSGVFAYTTKIHAKLYIFGDEKNAKMYVGSQNFNFSSGNMELMLETPLHPEVHYHVEELFADSKNTFPITGVVNIKGTKSDPFTRKVTTAEVFHYDAHLDHRKMQLVESIDLRAICEKNPIGSLNLYHGKGRLNSTTGIYTPRPWYEVELTLGRDKYPGLPRDFRAFTDDGIVIEMQRRSGGPAGQPELGLKDLTSKGNRQLFGEWIKGKLESAGALEVGDVIDGSTFDTFGADQLQFYRMNDNEFYMLFG
jgi:hypothetical protein